uniref:CRC domain-containing protein n=1 Tax=Mucochytrium quahogii TaxID=96639 RepID=A0A7S2RXN2_9STRA|mmetsp:Transcript_4892/g.7401  ORF Transcript_4892/g.7401 Transcript_4892/m.7401 type:complete len:388 (+) Transcript_4892:220-1383(+)
MTDAAVDKLISEIKFRIKKDLEDGNLRMEAREPLEKKEREELDRRRESLHQQLADIDYLIHAKQVKLDKMRGYFAKLELEAVRQISETKQFEVDKIIERLRARTEPFLKNLRADIASLGRAKDHLRDKYWAKLYEDKYHWSLGLPVSNAPSNGNEVAEIVASLTRDEVKSLPTENKTPSEKKAAKKSTKPAVSIKNEQQLRLQEQKVAKAKKRFLCSCKKSKCLKLYCDCFAANQRCSALCSCTDCRNDSEHEAQRTVAIEMLKERKPMIFDRVGSSGSSPTGALLDPLAGCKCRKSRCLKKYCVCYGQGEYCKDTCRCIDCMNHDNQSPTSTGSGSKKKKHEMSLRATGSEKKREASEEFSPLDLLFEASKQDQSLMGSKRVRLTV